MAEDDEIDILGDFSFNSCLAQNNQGIPSRTAVVAVVLSMKKCGDRGAGVDTAAAFPHTKNDCDDCGADSPSCSDREDTVHPQWLLDSVSTNWYDIQSKDRARVKEGPPRRLTGNRAGQKFNGEAHTTWSLKERQILAKEMSKYGRNIRKISQTLKTKTEAEIQALIEAEFGVHLETQTFGLDKDENDGTPTVAQEEIVTDDVTNVLSIITTGTPTVPIPKAPFVKNTHNTKSKSLLCPDIANSKQHTEVNTSEIFYEDDMIIGLTESVGSDIDSIDVLSQKMAKEHKEKVKAMKKIGNHRRKVSRNYDRGKRNRSKDLLKSMRQRKDSSISDESAKNTKMQIVFSSGQALPVSEGEQVIKIEKKKDSEPESDIEIDVDSEEGDSVVKKGADKKIKEEQVDTEGQAAAPLRKMQPMPKRQKAINLSGEGWRGGGRGRGGYTIMHTAAGDLYEVGAEPRRERAPRTAPVHLLHCRMYNADNPAPYEVHMHVSCLIAMDVHAHTSRAEVMGLAGGHGPAHGRGPAVTVCEYRPAAAAAGGTHCDMDPVSQAAAAEALHGRGLSVVAWHHSHPHFPPAPSRTDLRTQRALQRAFRPAPLLGLITSQHWPAGRRATQYRCIRVDDSTDDETPTGYQFSVKLIPDLSADNVAPFLLELRTALRDTGQSEHSVDLNADVCPQANITYLEKSISSMRHLMHSAGYEDGDAVVPMLVQGVRDVFR